MTGRIIGKLLGAVLPFAIVFRFMTPTHPIRSLILLGASILWANAAGYIERGLLEGGLL